MKPLSATEKPPVVRPGPTDWAATVLFRADGGNVGAGHLMRCLGLAQELADRGAHCRLVTVTPDAPPVADWRGDGFAVDVLPQATEDDAGATAALARRRHARWIVLDGYGFDSAYRRRLKAACGTRLLAYVDRGPLPTALDLAVNQNPGAEDRHRARQNALLGPRFVTLRRSVRRLQRRPNPSVPNVLVTFGAADRSGLARRVADGLAGTPEAFTADVAITSGNTENVISDPRIALTPYTDMIPLLARADVAVCGGGITSLELASLGVPLILVRTADNQTGTDALVKSGGAVFAGAGGKAVARAVALCRALLVDPKRRQRMSERARRMVDGNGAARVADAMVALETAT